ncbi:MAG: hypothetical protein AAFV45_11200 [Pseudomonadota bacterium]
MKFAPLCVCAGLAALTAAPIGAGKAIAGDDDVTRHERAEIREAIRDIGCRTKGMDIDKKSNGTFEVEDVRCPDGEEYEFLFTSSFELIGGKRD